MFTFTAFRAMEGWLDIDQECFCNTKEGFGAAKNTFLETAKKYIPSAVKHTALGAAKKKTCLCTNFVFTKK